MNRTIKNYLFLATFFLGYLTPSLCLAIEGSQSCNDCISYQTIGGLYAISSCSAEVPPTALSMNCDIGFTKKEDDKKPNLEIPFLDEQEKRTVLLSLLHKNSPEGFSQEPGSMFGRGLIALLKDLDVYSCQGEIRSNSLMSKIDNTVTIFGEIGLAKMLANPTNDVATLHARQALIKELIENPSLFEKVEVLMRQLKSVENGFFSFWREDDPVSADYFNSFYYNKDMTRHMNSSSLALDGLVRLGNLGTIWKAFGDAGLLVGFNYLIGKMGVAFAQRGGHEVDPYTFKNALIETGSQLKGFFNPQSYRQSYTEISKLGPDLKKPDGTSFTADEIKLTRNLGYGVLTIQGVLATVFLANYCIKIKAALDNALLTKNAVNYLQTRLIDVAGVVSVYKSIKELAQENSCFVDALPSDPLDRISSEFDQLVTDLQTSTFSGSASFFSYSGRVLSAYKLMNSCKDEFAGMLEFVGELDACLSFAKLYKKFEQERVHYSFVQYEESQVVPRIVLDELWNPFVDHRVVVTNDLSIGKEEPNDIILTGSNTGGKSTILKAILINLLLAHTSGVVPAGFASITPLSYLGSYLHVNDDIGAGNSLFKAEVLRAQSLVDTLSLLEGGQFGFVVIDELFTGTSSAKGENAAYKITERLLSYPNASFILATHYPLLTELEVHVPGTCVNYKIEVFKDDAGNLVRPFKWQKGISTNNVADDILRSEFEDMDFDF